MPRQEGTTVENSFVKGLITEATGLNFPENACYHASNCVFDSNGTVSRRLGLDVESSAATFPITVANQCVTEFLWEGVAQSGEIAFLVLQIGFTLRFFGTTGSSIVHNHKHAFDIYLGGLVVPGATIDDIVDEHCSFAVGNGMLFVAHPHCHPFYIKYNSDNDTIEIAAIEIKIRDTEGLPNNDSLTGAALATNQRPVDVQFNQAIYYNLLNQGWFASPLTTVDGRSWGRNPFPALASWKSFVQFADLVPPISGRSVYLITAKQGIWPSEADVWHAFKGPIVPVLDSEGNAIPPVPPVEAFSLIAIDKVVQGNTPAGKGHYILNAMAEDRLGALHASGENAVLFAFLGDPTIYAGSSALHTNITNNNAGIARPSQICFYAGRVFYAGVNSSKYNNKIYFSQILEGEKHINECYQSQDPTSELSSDLLPSDGGVIMIQDVAKIVKLIVLAGAIYVFATNGIWRLGGSNAEGIGFAANDYSVTKVSDIGSLSPQSFVMADGVVMWWNQDGIHALKLDQVAGVNIQSISNNTIQSFVDNLPASERRYVKGAYNSETKIVQWICRSEVSSTVDERYKYDTVLSLDLTSGAFYPWSIDIDNSDHYISGIFCIEGASADINEEDVTDQFGNPVTDSGGFTVTTEVATLTDISTQFKFVIFDGFQNYLFFGGFTNDGNLDWDSVANGVAYESSIISGYKIRGDAIRRQQNNYIRIYSGNNSAYNVSGRWDYAITNIPGRWTSVQRVEMDDNENFGYMSKRLKIRGSGNVFQLKIVSAEQEPFSIIGWSTLDSVNARP